MDCCGGAPNGKETNQYCENHPRQASPLPGRDSGILAETVASWLRNLGYALALTTADDFVDAAPRPFVTSNVKATFRNLQSGLQIRADDHNINKRFLTRAVVTEEVLQREWLKLQNDPDASVMLDPPNALVPAAGMEGVDDAAASWSMLPPAAATAGFGLPPEDAGGR